MVNTSQGLSQGKEVVDSWFLLRRDCGFGGNNPRFRIRRNSYAFPSIFGGCIFISFLSPAAAVLFGFMAGTICNFATEIKYYLKCDDALDVIISSTHLARTKLNPFF